MTPPSHAQSIVPLLANAISLAGLDLSSGITFIIHVVAARVHLKKDRQNNVGTGQYRTFERDGTPTVGSASHITTKSYTHFTLPEESINENREE